MQLLYQAFYAGCTICEVRSPSSNGSVDNRNCVFKSWRNQPSYRGGLLCHAPCVMSGRTAPASMASINHAVHLDLHPIVR